MGKSVLLKSEHPTELIVQIKLVKLYSKIVLVLEHIHSNKNLKMKNSIGNFVVWPGLKTRAIKMNKKERRRKRRKEGRKPNMPILINSYPCVSKILGNTLVCAISFPFPYLNRSPCGKYTPTAYLTSHILPIS